MLASKKLPTMTRQDCIRMVHEHAEQLKLTKLSPDQKKLVDSLDYWAFMAYTSETEIVRGIDHEKTADLPVIKYRQYHERGRYGKRKRSG